MEKRTLRNTLTEALGGTEVQRGIKLGAVAGGIALVILFGAGALLHQSSETIDLNRGQIAPLVILFIAGMLALVVAAVLAFYAGLSAPEVKSGEVGRAGLLSGAITMLLFWVAQTAYGLVDAAQGQAGVKLDAFFKTALIRGIAFFVIGGLFGWWGARSAARRARSILSPSTSLTLSALSASVPTRSVSSQESIAGSAGSHDLASERNTPADANQATEQDQPGS